MTDSGTTHYCAHKFGILNTTWPMLVIYIESVTRERPAGRDNVSHEYKMQSMNKTRISPVLVILLTFYTVEASAMGLFDFLKVCLFSEVNGVVTLEGKPVAGAELVRTAEIGEKVHTDKTVTDEEGRFYFPAMYTHSVYKIAPVEPVIPQSIIIQFEGGSYSGWQTTRRGYDENAEMKDNRNIVLTCELTDEESIKVKNLRRPVAGICKNA